MGKTNKLAALIAMQTALVGGFEMPEPNAKDKRLMKRKFVNEPPRSMTEEEKEYYQKHKTLTGYKPKGI